MKPLAYSRFVYALLGRVVVLFLDGAVYAQAARNNHTYIPPAGVVYDGKDRSYSRTRSGLTGSTVQAGGPRQ
ncbi:hypothetical protein MYX65_00355 [Acidobacteria bacterium AH-259-L09]|nr:hypothetical protein [Acidobacteria bacterium AH-259-L09]